MRDSARAIATIDGAGLLDEDELPGAKKVLRAAALTYVAALLMFVLAGQVYYAVAIPATLFSIAGNWLGSGMAIKNGEKFIRPVMFAVLCLLLVKIGYDMLIS